MALQGSGLVKIVYVLYLAGYVTGGITTIIGLIMAYIGKADADDIDHDHLRFAIRTFWIGMLYAVISGVLTMVIIGFLLLVLQTVWFIVRCIKGLLAIDKGEPPADVETWLF